MSKYPLFEKHMEQFRQNSQHEIDKRKQYIRTFVNEAGAKGVVLGLSGGIDSATTAALCTEALGKENVLALWMGAKSNPMHLEDAQRVAKRYGFRFISCDLTDVVQFWNEKCENYAKQEGVVDLGQVNLDLAHGNNKARIRKNTEYWFAAIQNYLVANTCNWSETAIGYETKYGDAAGDFSVLGDLVKQEVYAIAEALDMPRQLIEKAPSADLWDNHTDEGELSDKLGFSLTYYKIDAYLTTGEGNRQAAYAIKKLYRQSAHKRNPMPVLHVRDLPKEEHIVD